MSNFVIIIIIFFFIFLNANTSSSRVLFCTTQHVKVEQYLNKSVYLRLKSTCFKRPPFQTSKSIFFLIKHVLRDHLPYETTVFHFIGRSLKTGLTGTHVNLQRATNKCSSSIVWNHTNGRMLNQELYIHRILKLIVHRDYRSKFICISLLTVS